MGYENDKTNIYLKAVLTILFFFAVSALHSQTTGYQQLIDTATKNSGLFINSKPLTVTLDKDRIFLYNEWLFEQEKFRLPDSIYFQLINNSKKADTSLWTDQELPSFIIVNGKYSQIDSAYVLSKFIINDSDKAKRLNSQVKHYNTTNPQDRRVYYFSRPVFDNSKSFAVVQYDNGHSGLMGGGGIKLYHFEKNVWKELALLVRWSY